MLTNEVKFLKLLFFALLYREGNVRLSDCRSVGQPTLVQNKLYLKNFWMDCQDILYRQSGFKKATTDCGDPMTFPPVETTMKMTFAIF